MKDLIKKIAERISGKRFTHTLGVEREIENLAKIYLPTEDMTKIRAAGLLHDITKQLSLEKQLQLCEEFGIIYTERDKLSPKTFHAKTAVEVIRRDFPEYACDDLLGAVRYHTTGRADMSMLEKLLYLADYIEDTRTFPDCVELRRYFYNRIENEPESARDTILRDTLILSFDMTIRLLIEDGDPIHPDTINARNYLIEEKELEKHS